MTGTSAGGIIVMVVVILVSLLAMLSIVFLVVRHPHWKHPKIDTKPGDVRGGIHVGDPGSVAPRRDAPANPPER